MGTRMKIRNSMRRYFVPAACITVLLFAGCFKPPAEPEEPVTFPPMLEPAPEETPILPTTGTVEAPDSEALPEGEAPVLEDEPETESPEDTPTEPEPGLTFDNITRIQEGMDYFEVALMLGSPGLTIANDGAMKTINKWSQGEASFLGRFEDGVLVRKAVINMQPLDRGEKPELSESAYNEITEGMPIEEVIELLDVEGQLVSDNTPGVTIYRWADAQGTTFTARFEEGKLVRKTGLLVAALEKTPGETAEEHEPGLEGEVETMEDALQEEGELEEPEPTPRRIATLPEPDEEDLNDTLEPAPLPEAPTAPPPRPRVHVAGADRRARAAEQDVSPVAGRSYKPRAKLPDRTFSLRRGAFEVRIHNTGESNVEVGLRSGNRGRDLTIPAGGTRSAFVDSGSYQLFYVFKDSPYTLHQGTAIPIDGLFLSDTEVYLFDGGTDIRGLDYGYP